MAAETAPAVLSGGYNCRFVTKPDNIPTECPLCHLILREPFQVTCCGATFCESCIKTLLEDSNVCPITTCKSSRPQYFVDKRLKQTLHGLRVICGERSVRSVCDWTGELDHVDSHLNLDPSPEKQLVGCRFAKIKCKFCYGLYLRRNLNFHQQKRCPRRPFICRHCGHEDTHESGVRNHLPVCPRYPTSCPNCYHTHERQDLEHHINGTCPWAPIPCDYHVIGCRVTPARCNRQSHIKREALTHVSLLQQHLKQHPQQSNDCLPLVAPTLEQLMVICQECQEKKDAEPKFVAGCVSGIMMIVIGVPALIMFLTWLCSKLGM